MIRSLRIGLLPLLLLLAGPAPAAALTPEQAVLERARQLVDLVETREAMEAAALESFDRQMALVRRNGAGPGARDLASFRAHFMAELERSLGPMLDAVSRIYATHFTMPELDELVAFYTSPVGRKALARSPLIMAEAEAVGAAWGARVGRRAMQRFQTERAAGLES